MGMKYDFVGVNVLHVTGVVDKASAVVVIVVVIVMVVVAVVEVMGGS